MQPPNKRIFYLRLQGHLIRAHFHNYYWPLTGPNVPTQVCVCYSEEEERGELDAFQCCKPAANYCSDKGEHIPLCLLPLLLSRHRVALSVLQHSVTGQLKPGASCHCQALSLFIRLYTSKCRDSQSMLLILRMISYKATFYMFGVTFQSKLALFFFFFLLHQLLKGISCYLLKASLCSLPRSSVSCLVLHK